MGNLLGGDDWRRDFQYRGAGINHFLWLTQLKFRGRDAFSLLREMLKSPDFLKNIDNHGRCMDAKDVGSRTSMLSANKLKFELFRRYGALPAAGDRHLAEFLSWVRSDSPERLAKDWDIAITTIETRYRMLSDYRNDARQMYNGTQPLPQKPSIESFAHIIAALNGEICWRDMLNVPNLGQVNNLPEGAILECPVIVDRKRIEPVFYGSMPENLRQLLLPLIEEQRLMIKAAAERNNSLAVKALQMDPWGPPPQKAAAMWRELTGENSLDSKSAANKKTRTFSQDTVLAVS